MVFSEVLLECVKDPGGIVSVATVSAEHKPHIANTWNKYLILTEDGKILMPLFGFRKTEANINNDAYTEVTLGSDKVQGRMGMGTGFLLVGTSEVLSEGELFDKMHDKCNFASRVLVFTPEKCTQTV